MDRQNSLAFFSAFYSAFVPIHHLSNLIDPEAEYYYSHPLLLYHVGYSENLFDEDECFSGRIQAQEANREERGQLLRITFNRCEVHYGILGSAFFDGTIVYRGETNSGEVVIRFDNLSIETDLDTLTYKGAVTQNGSRSLSADELLISSSQAKGIRLTDFSMQFDSISGYLSLEDEGWVSISYEEHMKELQLMGARDSTLTGIHDSFHTMNEEGDFQPLITTYEMELITPFENTHTSFNSNILLPQILFWPYVDNMPPTIKEDEAIPAIRQQPILLTADRFSDPEGDFISVEWSIARQPADCLAELADTPEGTVLLPPCHGDLQLQALVSDGINPQAEFSIEVNVAAQFAQIELPEVIEIGNNDIDIQIEASNHDADGPFAYVLAYAPQGVSLSEEGRLTGRPQAFAQTTSQTFKIGVQQAGEPDTLKEIEITMSDEGPEVAWLPSADACNADNQVWNDINGNGLPEIACLHGGSYFIWEKGGPTIRFSHAETKMSGERLLNITQFDLTDNGLDEIILRFETHIVILDGPTKTEIRRVAIKTESIDLQGSRLDARLASVLGIYLGVNRHTNERYLYDFHSDSFNTLPSTANWPYLREVFNDSMGTFGWTDGGTLYDLSNHTSEYYGNLRYADFNHDGTKELLTYEFTYEGTFTHFNIYKIDPIQKTKTLAAQVIENAGNSDRLRGTPSFIRFNDTKEQLVFFGSTIHVYDFTGSRYQYRGEIERPDWCDRDQQLSYGDRSKTFYRQTTLASIVTII